ncbi:MAG: monooxygenase [Streptosporangiales bacterium]|nr:monooxygenase [Streptosporangiales bacterium]
MTDPISDVSIFTGRYGALVPDGLEASRQSCSRARGGCVVSSRPDTVVVVGAGPTGLALACELGLAGLHTRVLERREAPRRDSRAICLHARSVEMLDLRGLGERFLEAGLPVPSFPLGPKGAVIDFRRLDSDFPFILDIPQSQIESILLTRAQELGVEIQWSAEVVDVAEDDAGVRLRVEGPAGAGEERAAYVVACDGLRSLVRERLNVPFPGAPNPGSVTLADVYLDGLPMTDAHGELSEGGMLLVFPFRDGSCRVVLYDYARASVPVTEPVGLDEVREGLVRVTGSDFGVRDLYWSSRYRSESRQATRYRVGRIFLAGDAAHTHSPAGAQGLNAGFQDAMNLGWKLGAAVAGWAPDWLLDSYHTERHPVGEQVLRLTGMQFRLNTARNRRGRLRRRAAYRLVTPLPPVQAWMARRYSGVSVAYPPTISPSHRLTGTRLPGGRLTLADGTAVRVSELFHDARFVLLESARDGKRADLADLPDHVRAVSYVRRDGRAWPPSLLVRPDGYAAWASDEPDPGRRAPALREALRTWCSRADAARSTRSADTSP